MTHVLVVDDESGFADGISEYLRMHGHSVASADSLDSARIALSDRPPGVVLLDLMLPDGSGLELFDEFKQTRPDKIVIITGHSGIKSLIGDVAGDGVAYMRKPIDPRELLSLINTTSDDSPDEPEAKRPQATFASLVGQSDAMQEIFGQIERVAKTDSTVFIQGESGTGKELIADAIHQLSGRQGRFVPVNCGGLTKELISSQLFGHEKGAFTGAVSRHTGLFERASGGTLFLDEVTEMPPDMQTQLLRVLETRRLLRVGGVDEIEVDTRLIAATNRDPAEAVREKTLREDLYFRLRVFPIVVPPLRDRAGDVKLLAEHFLEAINDKHGTAKTLTPEALQELEVHSWPGNVRELKHTIHRAYIMADGDQIDAPSHIDDDVSADVEGLRVGRSIADVEKDLILATLEHYSGDKKAAAASLGISLKTLYNRLKEYENDDSTA